MTISQFRLLDEAEKEEAIWADGIFLANYDDGNFICDAYSLCEFYVGFCYILDKNLKAKISAHIYADELPHLFRIKNFYNI